MPLPFMQAPSLPSLSQFVLSYGNYQTVNCCRTGFSFGAEGSALMKKKIFYRKLDMLFKIFFLPKLFSALSNHRSKILTDFFRGNVTQYLGSSSCVTFQVNLRRSQFSAFLFYFIFYPLCNLN